ncbi:SDR family oxidoreductase [Flindersiella endophytica]
MPFAGVTAAGGQTGRSVVRELARRGIRVRGLVHSAKSAEAARQAGAAEAVSVELGDRASVAAAISGLDTLVFIAPPFEAREEAYVAGALGAAVEQQVPRFVYYSVLHPQYPGVPHHLRKLAAETLVKDSGLEWTIIRPTMYQQTLLGLADNAADGVLRLAYSKAAPFWLVDLENVAYVVGRVVAEAGDHVYASYELAGPERLTTAEMVEQIGRATGRDLRVEEVPPTELPLPPGLPRQVAAELMAMWAKYDRGGYPGNPNVLRYLLGREPTPLATTAARDVS